MSDIEHGEACRNGCDKLIAEQAEQITRQRNSITKLMAEKGHISPDAKDAVIAEQAEQITQANDVSDACREASTMLKAENQRLKECAEMGLEANAEKAEEIGRLQAEAVDRRSALDSYANQITELVADNEAKNDKILEARNEIQRWKLLTEQYNAEMVEMQDENIDLNRRVDLWESDYDSCVEIMQSQSTEIYGLKNHLLQANLDIIRLEKRNEGSTQ